MAYCKAIDYTFMKAGVGKESSRRRRVRKGKEDVRAVGSESHKKEEQRERNKKTSIVLRKARNTHIHTHKYAPDPGEMEEMPHSHDAGRP